MSWMEEFLERHDRIELKDHLGQSLGVVVYMPGNHLADRRQNSKYRKRRLRRWSLGVLASAAMLLLSLS